MRTNSIFPKINVEFRIFVHNLRDVSNVSTNLSCIKYMLNIADANFARTHVSR